MGSRVCSSGDNCRHSTTAALSDMYEPNQYVMNCGIVDPTAGPIRFSSPISRNLNNGDAIVLLVRHTLGGNMDIRGTCRYAITPPVIFTLHLKFIFHMKFVGPVDVRSFHTPSGAVTLYRPFLSILIQKMEIETEIIRDVEQPVLHPATRAGGTQGTPINI